MKKKTSNPMKVPATAGKNPTNPNLAESYLDWLENPECKRRYDTLGVALDLRLRRNLPERKLAGLLAGREGDIRQDTAKELLDGFFAGSEKLQSAVATKKVARIDKAMEQCIRICLAINRKRTIEVEAAHKGEAEKHPLMDMELSVHELEYTMRMRIVNLLSSTVAAKEFAKEEIKLLRRLIVDEASREQTASDLRKSHSWISKRLKKIKKKLHDSEPLRRVLEADM